MGETTETDWRTMEAGRELDRIVAERVLGAATRVRQVSKPEYHTFSNRRKGWRVVDVYEETKNDRGSVAGWGHLYAYSTSIDAAWRVVAAMAQRDYWLDLRDFPGHDVHAVAVFTQGAPRPRYEGVAFNSAPLAICRAALDALDA